MKSKAIIFLVLSVLCACKPSVLDYKSYMAYLANKDNGLTKENAAAGIKLKVKYLPLDYQVYNAIKSLDAGSKETESSIRKSYENSLTFLFTLGPDDDESFSITRLGVKNYEEFAQRIETMSFGMKEFITLRVKDKEYKPDLAQMESINSLEQSKSIIVVFNAVDSTGAKIMNDDLTFVYSDEIFNTGISRFDFKLADIKGLPALKIKD